MSEEETTIEETTEETPVGTTETPDYEAQLKEKDTQVEELQKELTGLKNKEYNFKKLRDMTEDEKKELTTREVELIQRTEKLEEEQKSFSTRVVDGHKLDAFAVLAGDDAELLKKIQYHYERISDDATTRDEVNKKAKDAWLLANGGANAGIDPIARAAAYQSGHGVVKTGERLTGDQRDLASKLGISDDDLKKYSK